jgi:formate/nitrite transporter FocA (FNT family)
MKKYIILALLISFITNNLNAQTVSSSEIEMADKLIANGKIYIVVGVLCIVFICISIYLFLLDKRVTNLEKNK